VRFRIFFHEGRAYLFLSSGLARNAGIRIGFP
jgi:hypothetical protein